MAERGADVEKAVPAIVKGVLDARRETTGDERGRVRDSIIRDFVAIIVLRGVKVAGKEVKKCG